MTAATRIKISMCHKQGFRVPKVVCYDINNRRWFFRAAHLLTNDTKMLDLIRRVREAGSIDPALWRQEAPNPKFVEWQRRQAAQATA